MRGRLIALAIALSCAAPAPAAVAAPEPVAPLAVAPGVPGAGRAWELVTSPDPQPLVLWQVRALAATGEGLSYTSIGYLPGWPTGLPLVAPNRASRGAGGWDNAPDFPPNLEIGEEPGPVAFDPAMANSVWVNQLPGGEFGLYRQGPAGGFTTLVEGAAYAGSSTDLEHVVFSSARHLVPKDVPRTSGSSIYEAVGSTLRLVDVKANGGPLSICGSTISGSSSVSRDGGRIFFSTHRACAGSARIFLREGGTTTTEISASQCDLPACGPEADAYFDGATPSGSSAFLYSTERLTDDDANSHGDLYRYDVGDGELSRVSTTAGGGDVVPNNEMVRVSGDGSRAYFGGAEETAPGVFGPAGLYLADPGGLHLIPGATPSTLPVSADGRYLVYATAGALLPEDTDTAVDVYRYDAATHSVTRVSAGPVGGNAATDASLGPGYLSEAFLASSPYRVMSEDGSRIFFLTAERLLPQDTNEVTDVYEWAGGSLALVSSGAGSKGSAYIGTTPDGRTAFIETADTLLGRDQDNGDHDIYAARIGGGFAEPAPTPSCAGSCQAGPRGSVTRPFPASARGATGGIRIDPPGAAARRRIVASGWIVLAAEVPAAGRLSAAARARFGGGRRTIATTSVRAVEAGPVRLRMRLSAAARKRLAGGGDLQVRISLRLSHLDPVRRLGFRLEGRR